MKKFITIGENFLLILLSGLWIAYGLFAVVQKNAADFTAFYGAAKNILGRINPYGLYKTFAGGGRVFNHLYGFPISLFP